MANEDKKLCPMLRTECREEECSWWCGVPGDCSVPLLAWVMTASSINTIDWEAVERSGSE